MIEVGEHCPGAYYGNLMKNRQTELLLFPLFPYTPYSQKSVLLLVSPPHRLVLTLSD